MKKILFLIVLLGTTTKIFAQNRILEGTVRDSLGKALGFANLTLHDSIGKPIVAFAVADAQGRYRLALPQMRNYWLQARLLGYAANGVWIGEKNTHDFVLKTQITVLNEVVIRQERKISIRPDTITFKADEFRDSTETVMEDLLKKLPGVEVSDDGSIKVQGVPIKKILIEGDDLFNRNYKMLSRNLSADIIDKVQVIDRYVDNKFLVGLVPSEDKALNITLKEDRKSSFFGNMTAGAGNDHRYTLSGNGISFVKKMKMFNFLKFNTLGQDVKADIGYSTGWAEGTNSVQNAQFSENELSGLLNVSRGMSLKGWASNFNQAGLLASSFLIKPSPKTRLRALIYGVKDYNRQFQNNFYQYRLENNNFVLSEDNRFSQAPLLFNANLEYTWDIDSTSQLRLQNEFRTHTELQKAQTLANENNLNNELKNKQLYFANSLEYIKRLNQKSILISNLYYLYNQNEQNLQISQNARPLPFALGNYAQIEQTAQKPLRYFSWATQWLTVLPFGELKFTGQISQQSDEFFSSLEAEKQKLSNFENQEKFEQSDYLLAGRYTYRRGKFQIFSEIEGHFYKTQRRSLAFMPIDTAFFYVLPQIGIKIGHPNRRFLSAYYSYKLRNPQLTDLYGSFVLSNYRTMRQGSEVFLAAPSHSLGLSYRVSDFEKGIIYFGNMLYLHTEKAYNNQINIDANYNLYSRLPLLMPQKRASLGGGVDKYFSAISMTIKLHAQASWAAYQNRLNNSVLRETQAWTYNFEVMLHTVFLYLPNLYVGWKANYSLNDTQTGQEKMQTQNAIHNPYFDVVWAWRVSKIRLKWANDIFYFEQNPQEKAYWFSKLSAYYDFKPNKLTFSLTGNNLLNTYAFVNTSVTDYSESRHQLALLPRYLLLEAFWRF